MSSTVNFLRTRPTAWIRVTGEDSAQFLQSQFSNDLLVNPDVKACVYGLWLDRKGRIAADSFVFRIKPNEFILGSYDSPAAAIISKLEAFIIADDVELEDETDSMMLLSLWGDGSAQAMTNWGFRIPAAGAYVEQGGMFVTQGRRSDSGSLDIYFPEDGEDWILQRLSEKNSVKLVKADEADAELERIRCAIPSISKEAAGGVIPQELALEGTAVSFNKGCYLGQEVMARVRQTGRFTRQLHKLRLDSQPPATPATLTLDDAEVGQLTSAARDPDEGWIGLALLKKNRLEGVQGPFLLENNANATLE